jgi:serine/threonine-protein phosphatase 2A regulatory subunit B''
MLGKTVFKILLSSFHKTSSIFISVFMMIDAIKFPSAKIKLEQFFLEWLATEGETILETLIEEIGKTNLNSEKNGHINDSKGSSSTTLDHLDLPTNATALTTATSSNITTYSRSPKKRTQSEMSPETSDHPLNSSNGPNIKSLLKLSTEVSSDEVPEILGSALEVSASRRRANFDAIPRFYFHGQKTKSSISNRNYDDHLSRRLPEIEAYFKPYPNGIPIDKFVHITKKLCGLPSFFNLPFCKLINEIYGDQSDIYPPSKSSANKANKTANSNVVKLTSFLAYWQAEIEPYNIVERFFRVVKQRQSSYICKDDFVPYMKELLHFHPGLEFLSSHDEFKRKYALTVITRIFYKVNVSRTGKITLRELKASNLVTEFTHVDEEIDINKVTEYFSYEHFYVLYCRFFELDVDKDGRLSRDDLAKYGDFCLSDATVDRLVDTISKIYCINA